jgi:hypothetical protein
MFVLVALSKLYRLSVNSSHVSVTQEYNVYLDTQYAGNLPTSKLLSRCLGLLIIIGAYLSILMNNR